MGIEERRYYLYKGIQELKEKESSLQDEMHSLQKEYEKSYYLQKGDRCIDMNGKMCWFSRLYWKDCYDYGPSNMVCYPKKDGTPSNIEEEIVYVLKKVEVPSADEVDDIEI